MANGGDNSYLPEDMIINILKRLPVKSIVRFQSVCKEWKNLFKTSYFTAEHARHTAHKSPLLLLHATHFCHDEDKRTSTLRLVNHEMETVEDLSIPSIDSLRHRWRIIGSSNGLLCVEVDLDLDTYPRSLCLWNPMLRKVREIEIPHTNKDYGAFSVFGFGFGFSSIVDDYKIVKFYSQELPKKKSKEKEAVLHRHHGAKVYSLRAGSWKEVELGASHNTRIISKPVSSVDGTILWLGVRDSFHVVVSFDIAAEVFTLTPIPLGLPFEGLGCLVNTTTLGVHQKKFVIFRRCCNRWKTMDIWVMEEVASESGKSFSCIQKHQIGIISSIFDPVCIWRNEIVCRNKCIAKYYRDKYTDDEDEPDHHFLRAFNVITKKWKVCRKTPD